MQSFPKGSGNLACCRQSGYLQENVPSTADFEYRVVKIKPDGNCCYRAFVYMILYICDFVYVCIGYIF